MYHTFSIKKNENDIVIVCENNMKITKYHTVATFAKSNRKLVERGFVWFGLVYGA